MGGNYSVGFAVGDFNGDGNQDIAALVDIPGQNSDSSEIYLFLGNGDGTFQSPKQFPASPWDRWLFWRVTSTAMASLIWLS